MSYFSSLGHKEMHTSTHFQRILFCCRNVVLFTRKVEGPWPTWPPGCAGPGIAVNKSKCKYFEMILKFVILFKCQFYSAVFHRCAQ